MEHEQRDWSHFALLLVDVQRSFWPVRGWPDFPDIPANVARLLALCRSEGLEVIGEKAHLSAAFMARSRDILAPPYRAGRGRINASNGVNLST